MRRELRRELWRFKRNRLIHPLILFDPLDLFEVVHHGLQPALLLVQLLLQLLHDLYLDLCMCCALVIQYVATEK